MNLRLLIISIGSLMGSEALNAQGSTFGPGKGPAPGTSKSKYTYPQPPKPTVYSPTSIRPAYEVPEKADKSTWRLTSKVDGKDPPVPTTDVPIYSFQSSGRRAQVGVAKAGEEIIMNEIRRVGKATYYTFNWSAAPQTNGPAKEYWVSGSNIEYAGPK